MPVRPIRRAYSISWGRVWRRRASIDGGVSPEPSPLRAARRSSLMRDRTLLGESRSRGPPALATLPAYQPAKARAPVAYGTVPEKVIGVAAVSHRDCEGDSSDGRRTPEAGRNADQDSSVAQVGAVSLRAAVGDRARGLQRQRRCMELLQP